LKISTFFVKNNIINVELAKVLGYVIFDVSYKTLANMVENLDELSSWDIFVMF
jgi:hypothetical protein